MPSKPGCVLNLQSLCHAEIRPGIVDCSPDPSGIDDNTKSDWKDLGQGEYSCPRWPQEKSRRSITPNG